MRTFFRRFRDDELGAITVDWVVLTASVLGMGLFIVSTITDSASDQTTSVGANLQNAALAPINFD